MAIIFLLVVRYVANDRLLAPDLFRWMALYPVYNSQQ